MGILYRSNKAEGEGEGRRVCRGPGDKRLIHVMLQRPAGRWPLAAGVARTGVPWRRASRVHTSTAPAFSILLY